MRITTNMTMRNYRNGLGQTLALQDTARNRVMTKRNFSKVSEDPAGAMKAFRLRKDFSKNDDYMETLKTVQGEIASVEASEQQIKKILDDAYESIQEAVGSPMDEEQKAIIATELRELQKSILLSTNAKFGNKFLFGGANTEKPPFELSPDGKILKYRGLDVNDPANETALKEMANEKLYVDIGFGIETRMTETNHMAGGTLTVDFNGTSVPIKLPSPMTGTGAGTPPAIIMSDIAREMQNFIENDASAAAMKAAGVTFTNNEGKLEIGVPDVGTNTLKVTGGSSAELLGALGLKAGDAATGGILAGAEPSNDFVTKSWSVVDSTAYNSAVSGLNLLGYGSSSDGISNNVIVLLGQIADKLEDPNLKPGDMDDYQKKLYTLRDKTLNNLTQLGTNSKFLKDTESRIEDNLLNLNTQIVKIEDVDMAGAITEYMWAQYAYNAALKVGNSLLSTSFIDFMK